MKAATPLPLHVRRLYVAVLTMSVFLLTACTADDPSSPDGGDSGKIRTGEMTQVVDRTVPSSGGTVSVSGTGTPIDGLELELPVNAYTASTTIRIAQAEITEHDFGQHFHPVTPLLRIENGGEFAKVPMRLRIPLTDLDGRFPLAFYYNRAEGTLEAIAPIARGDDWIDVAVRHFSEIVVSATQIELLRQGGGFHTLFDPAVNGWPFVNYGTYAAHYGMCAGMSIGAAYFYRDFKGTLQLRSHFDNDQYWFQTPKVWQDDANGLKFCAELQHAFITTSDIWLQEPGSPLLTFLNRSEEDHFWSFCYALLVNNQPQFVYLKVRDDNAADAHAILAYAYEIHPGEGRLKVYDPNYPGKEGTIIFDFGSGKFRPYTSAANAGALADGHTFNYDEIVFIPLSTLCDMKEIDQIWQKVASRTVGAGQYPEYELWAVPVDNEDLPRVKLLDAADGKTTYLPYRDFTVEIIQKDAGIPTALTAWIDAPDIKEIEKQDPAGIIVLANPGKNNLVGIQVHAIADDATDFSWAGFQWFKIRMQSLWLQPADTTVNMNQELRLVLRHNGTAPQNVRFEWDFGDGTTKTTITDSASTHTWTELGEYTVRVEMFEGTDDEAIGSAIATVNVTAYSSIGITLQGMGSTPPSTIKDSNGEDIPVIAWANTGDNPPLVWNKQNFSVDMKKTIYGTEVNSSISGRLSDDGSSIATMTAITSSVGNGGDFLHNFAIVITDFPLGEFGVVSPLGRGLSGPAAQARVANISYRMETKDNEGNITITEIESIDWSSEKTTLSVYFFQ